MSGRMLASIFHRQTMLYLLDISLYYSVYITCQLKLNIVEELGFQGLVRSIEKVIEMLLEAIDAGDGYGVRVHLDGDSGHICEGGKTVAAWR